MTHIRRFVLIAVIGGIILAGWTGAATARPIGIDTVSSAATPAGTVDPSASGSGEDSNLDLATVLGAGLVVFAGAAIATYAYRTRSRRRAIA